MKTTRCFFICLAVTLLLSGFAAGGALSAEPARILILPLKVNSDKDLTFLHKGIKSMLFSRLSMDGKAVLIDPEKAGAIADTGTPLEVAKRYSADYVVTGNMTVFGDSVSTDCSFIDVEKGTPAVTFNDFGENRGDALGHINTFTQQIKERVFHYAPHNPRPAPAYAGNPGVQGMGAMPGMMPSMFAANIWRSTEMPGKVKGMAVGDVDGDGANETVIVSDNELFLYRFQQGVLTKIYEQKGKTSDQYLGVDVADINGNGKSEIFITNLNQTNRRLRSFVLEWSGGALAPIAEGEKWFFRVIRSRENGDILLAQAKSPERDSQIFREGIHELKWENGIYVSDRRLDLPRKTVIYGLAFGDVRNEGKESFIALKPDGKLQMFDFNGHELWSGSDYYGGSGIYIKYPSEIEPRLSVNGGERQMDHYYLQQRLHISDIDRDGKNEVIVVNNMNLASRLFSKVRSFDNGHIEVLMWNTIGLQEKWKMQKVTGHISDYTIADLNNDGREEVVFSVIENKGQLTGNQKSYIVTWNSPS